LPRKQGKAIRSGSLSKKSRRTPRYTRFWFILKDDSFSYYNSAADVYFPAGTIDLRYAIKAELSGPKSTTSSFIIITEQRTYYFKADSPSSAHEWVKSLQKEIFRSKNEGDTVKIVIPIENIIDIEDIPMFDIGETLKIKAIDSDETYAIDEYVMAFFSHGQEARDAIKSLIKSAGLPSLDNEVEDLEKSSRTIKRKVLDTTTSYITDTPTG
jgi:sterol 3beta-glucosyltransferase